MKIFLYSSFAGRYARWLIFLILKTSVFMQTASSQVSTVPARLLGELNKYRGSYIQEKLYVHTDKENYISREVLWFRVFYVDASYHKPASISKIAYIEVLDKNNKPVLQEKVSLKRAESFGSLVIPSEIPSGVYRLRAYTNWMKNFDATYYFEKNIQIINPRGQRSDTSLKLEKRYDIQFFPEGGNLVENTESKVAFRVTDFYGQGLDFFGTLLNSNGDTVLKFRPLKMGMGNLSFTPVAGQAYRALLHFNDGPAVSTILPIAYASGYVMNVSQNETERIRVSVRCSTDLNGEPIFLLIHGKRSVLTIKSGTLIGKRADFAIDIKELEEGISQITVFNKAGKPVCERLFFKYPERKLNIATAINSEYHTREKVNIILKSTNQFGAPVNADMSLAVYRLDSFSNSGGPCIQDYMYLVSELGQIESPDFYFSVDGKPKEKEMDNLMLTHGWRRFDWTNIIEYNSKRPEFVPEYRGHIVQGKLIKNETGAMVSNTNAYLSIPSTNSLFRPGKSDDHGNIKFEIPNFYGSQHLILQTNPFEDSTVHVEVISPFSRKYTNSVFPKSSVSSNYSGSLARQWINEQIRDVYDGPRTKIFVTTSADTTTFYEIPDEKYLLQEYVRFQTMEEVFREYIHALNVSTEGGKYNIYLFDKTSREMFSGEPLILIDGTPLFNTNMLFQIDPVKIKRIDLINSRYCLGSQTYFGVLCLTTAKGDLDGVEIDPRAVILDYPGIADSRQFFSPQYDTEIQAKSRMPDYRTLLYWSPQIRTGLLGEKLLNFYTSDLPGKYAAVVQGLTENGVPGSRTITFIVRK